MKRYALLAAGPKDRKLTELFCSLKESGCLVGDSIISSFGGHFAAAMEVLGKDRKTFVKAVNRVTGLLTLKSKELAIAKSRTFGNVHIMLHGPNRPDALYTVSKLLDSSKAAVTCIESKTDSGGMLFAVTIEAYCPSRSARKKLEGRIHSLARRLGIKSSVSLLDSGDIP
ncbi:MAG: hypothetical protein H3C68_04255 [Deltaproteobacteria bacterium]|nr:hypothetical protein [Deltaproteobacteria bacterium]MBZ0219938.1 hypothetical protein [Deltaproteobacteria bacterium]